MAVTPCGCEGSRFRPAERIADNKRLIRCFLLQPYRPFGQFNREFGRMDSSALPSPVRDKPYIPPAMNAFRMSILPPIQIALVLIGHTNGGSIQWRFACFAEVKQVFVSIVQIAPAIDGLVVSERLLSYRYRFYPMNDVLQFPARTAELFRHIKRQPEFRRLPANVQEE